MEARKGQKPKELEVYDSARRLTIDGDLTDRSIDFMRRNAKGEKPFFLFIPYTQTHLRTQTNTSTGADVDSLSLGWSYRF